MSNTISASTPQAVSPGLKPTAPQAPQRVAGGKNDGDQDDGVSKSQASQSSGAPAPSPEPKPVTNTLGQLIGKTIDVQA